MGDGAGYVVYKSPYQVLLFLSDGLREVGAFARATEFCSLKGYPIRQSKPRLRISRLRLLRSRLDGVKCLLLVFPK
jgi:hypothetical protein